MAVHSPSFILAKPSQIGGGNWILKNLTDITVLFGKNGSGKSTLLRGLRDQRKSSRHYTSPERAGEFNFVPNIMIEESTYESRENKHNRNFSPQYREGVFSRIQAYLAMRGNLSNDQQRGDPRDIEKMMEIIMPDFRFKITGGNPPFSLIRTYNQENVTNVNQLSSGESEMISLALDILLICEIWTVEGQTEGVLLIDEPDTHLHPDLQQHLANFLVEVSQKYGIQMLVATHSTTLLSSLGFYGREKTSVVYLNNKVDDQCAIKFDSVLQEVSACLGGHILMGPLFGAPLLLVEGDDDYRIWSQVPRYSSVQMAVIPCNGDEIDNYRKLLEKILASITSEGSKTIAYMIRDADKTCGNDGYIHTKGLNLECHESENLYLSDEVLESIGTSWDQAKEKIRLNSSSFGNKAAELATVESWDRKTVDLKNIINEVSQIIDDKHVLWSYRVGKCIGGKRPSGQLAEFLGNELVISFWGQDTTTEV